MCRVRLVDGSEMDLGLDARIPKGKKDRVLFTGTYPGQAGTCLLARGSKEEKEIIDAVQAYLDANVGFLRREALAMANPAHLKEEDRSDAIAVDFISAIIDR